MSNLLRNPNLSGYTLGRYFTDKSGTVGTIEYPLEWEFTTEVREKDDPEKLPQSLHRDQGFIISAGYRSWEGGFVQRRVPLTGGTRYLAKVGFLANVNFPDNRVDLSAVTWRLVIETPLGTVAQDWQMTQKGSYGQYEELYLAFDCAQNTEASFHFEGRSVWAGNVCEIQVFSCSLEPVASDGSPVPHIGQSSPAAAQPAHPAQAAAPSAAPAASSQPSATPASHSDSQPSSQPASQPAPIGQRPTDTAPRGAQGGFSVSEDPYAAINALVAAPDFASIVATLRAARTPDGQPLDGFIRLADALDALKH